MRPRKRHATSQEVTSHGIYKMRPRILKGLNMGYSMRPRMRAQAHAVTYKPNICESKKQFLVFDVGSFYELRESFTGKRLSFLIGLIQQSKVYIRACL